MPTVRRLHPPQRNKTGVRSMREMKRNAGEMSGRKRDRPGIGGLRRKRTRPHGEKTARKKLEKECLRGRSDAVRPVRDGFAGAGRIDARRFRLKPPGKRRGRAAATHLNLNAVSSAIVHGGEVARMFRGGPESLRSRCVGNGKGGRSGRRDREQCQDKIQEQDEKEHPGGSRT